MYKVKGINVCKNYKLVKNGGLLYVCYVDINGLREGWKVDCKYRWVFLSLIVINCIYFLVIREFLICV